MGLRLAAAPAPVPDKLTVCWLPATLLLLSVMTSDAVRLPATAGVKVKVMVQLPPPASELPQVLV